MRGCSNPWLVRCDDGGYYVVKFPDNPQHVRILANEMIAGRLAQLIGLPVAAPVFVDVVPELVEADACPQSNLAGRAVCRTETIGFGSRFPGLPEHTLAVDFLPDRLLGRVGNLRDAFLGGFVFDKWTCNCDGRQVVFYRPVDAPGQPYTALLVDHGFCFNAGDWNFPDSPIRSLYPRRQVYETVTSLDSFQPYLSRIDSLPPSYIEACIADIPIQWCAPQPGELMPLMRKLDARRKGIADLIIEAKRYSYPFLKWV
jgi:hypothetical protein